MARGATAAEAVAIVMATTAYREYRQVLAVDVNGASAIYSGSKALGIWSEAREQNVACGGNLLANDKVPAAMVENFLASRATLATD